MALSKGHIGWDESAYGKYEWYERGGEVWRASVLGPMDLYGYRMGGRSQGSVELFERYRETVFGYVISG